MSKYIPGKTPTTPKLDRRTLLTSIGLAGSAALVGASIAREGEAPKWDREVDVICVGAGAAGCSAAIGATDRGASVLLLEKEPIVGGTTAKSGGVAWIPNNRFLLAEGLVDHRDDCLRYMARFSYPDVYNPREPNLGLPDLQYALLESFYDNGSKVVDRLQTLGAVKFEMFRMYSMNKLSPDYADDMPENKTPRGRAIWVNPGQFSPLTSEAGAVKGPGTLMIEQMINWLKSRNVPVLTDHRVTGLVFDKGRVVGVEVSADEKKLRFKARRGVVFGSGGYAHNVDFVGLHQPQLMGACARASSTGDFIPLAAEAGAKMGTLGTAWRSEVVVDEALDARAVGTTAFFLAGDSMIVVNKYGHRIVNEKRNYNDRPKVHFVYDPTREEYPNQFVFMVFDERTLNSCKGTYPIPQDRREVSYLIEGSSLEDLAKNIQGHVAKLEPRLGSFAVAPDFAQALKDSVARFNKFAIQGEDVDFGRGRSGYDKDYHVFSATGGQPTGLATSNLPNVTMYPLSDKGPFFAVILAAGALDTSGGPAINEHAQVIGRNSKPIAGLYGAGNCIAAPTRGAYYGAGGTVGPALTFGFIAGQHVASQPAAS